MTDKTNQDTLHSVDNYEFKPNPIKGYPELYWRGKKPFTSTRFYPAQLKETHGKSVDGPDGKDWHNKIFWGDNLQVMSHLLKEFRGKVDLIYIDPPFDSKADYKKKIIIKGQSASNESNAFEEKQYTDIWSNDEYLQFIYERLIISRELLSRDGVIYLHCDWHKSHVLRNLLDEVFGPMGFINEIIWKRSQNASSIGKIWKRAHDTILMYSKSSDYLFNFQRKSLSDASIQMYQNEDERGKYQLVPILVSGKRNGETGQIWRGIDPNLRGQSGMHWVTKPSKLEQYEKDDLIVWPQKKGGLPRLKYYLEDNEGVVISDIWDDINLISSNGKEAVGYPTQKPEELIERIILASSNTDSLVMDFFMGSGTTQAVAMKLGRRFIGADINLGAVQTTTKRLLKVADELAQQQPKLGEEQPTYYTGFEVYNVNNYDVFRNPVQARELLIEALEINKFPAGNLFDGELDGRLVKIMPVNRIATRADLNDLISGFDYAEFGRRKQEHPSRPVEKITLVCMGHEPDLKAQLQKEVGDFKLDVQVVDILRDRQDLQFKRDSEAEIVIENGELVIKQFYPLNLMQKLSLQQENVTDWREMVESVMIDWNYDGAVITEPEVDIPNKNGLVKGRYKMPAGASNIRVKITDLLSESLEMDVPNG